MFTAMKRIKLLQMRVGPLTKSFILEMVQWLYKYKEKRPIWCTLDVELPMFRHLRMKEEVTLELLTHIVV